jgi:hypothetical protein
MEELRMEIRKTQSLDNNDGSSILSVAMKMLEYMGCIETLLYVASYNHYTCFIHSYYKRSHGACSETSHGHMLCMLQELDGKSILLNVEAKAALQSFKVY